MLLTHYRGAWCGAFRGQKHPKMDWCSMSATTKAEGGLHSMTVNPSKWSPPSPDTAASSLYKCRRASNNHCLFSLPAVTHNALLALKLAAAFCECQAKQKMQWEEKINYREKCGRLCKTLVNSWPICNSTQPHPPRTWVWSPLWRFKICFLLSTSVSLLSTNLMKQNNAKGEQTVTVLLLREKRMTVKNILTEKKRRTKRDEGNILFMTGTCTNPSKVASQISDINQILFDWERQCAITQQKETGCVAGLWRDVCPFCNKRWQGLSAADTVLHAWSSYPRYWLSSWSLCVNYLKYRHKSGSHVHHAIESRYRYLTWVKGLSLVLQISCLCTFYIWHFLSRHHCLLQLALHLKALSLFQEIILYLFAGLF